MPATIVHQHANTAQHLAYTRKMLPCMLNVLSLIATVLICAGQQQHLWHVQTNTQSPLQTSFAHGEQKSVIRARKNVKNILIRSIVKIVLKPVAPVPKNAEGWNFNLLKTLKGTCKILMQGSFGFHDGIKLIKIIFRNEKYQIANIAVCSYLH